MPANLFIVEDEMPIVTLLKYNLEKEGHKVNFANNGEEALLAIQQKNPDLILLDWMLPDISGIEICKTLRKNNLLKDIPIIMLTAKGEEEDKLKGFQTGADDYVTKPFSQKELLARVNALLKRSRPSVTADTIHFEDLKVDRVEKRVFRSEKEVMLGPTEFKIIDFLISNPKRVYSREQLLTNIWGENIYVEERTIDVHIRRLRKAINIEGKKDLIRTVRSAGYSLDG
jgi:two-component system, OmpR family, phosphate regulon response regulator PhoB